MENAIAQYLNHIRNDYANWGKNDNMDETQSKIRAMMIEEFNLALHAEYGKKFIKIIKDGSVHSFIVIEDGPKWKAGDILKAATWKAPAQNFSRGNVFVGDFSRITWTGAQ